MADDVKMSGLRRRPTEDEAWAALEDHRKICARCRHRKICARCRHGADLDAMCDSGLALLMAYLNAP